DVPVHGRVDLDIACRGDAVGRWEVRLSQRVAVTGECVAPDAYVAKPRVPLRLAERVLVEWAVGEECDIEGRHGFPGRQRSGDLALPVHDLAVEIRVQVVLAVIPENSIGGDAVGDPAGIGPAVAAQGEIRRRGRRELARLQHLQARSRTPAGFPP